MACIEANRSPRAPRKFPGGEEKFKPLDADDHGYIERKEAEAVAEQKPNTPNAV